MGDLFGWGEEQMGDTEKHFWAYHRENPAVYRWFKHKFRSHKSPLSLLLTTRKFLVIELCPVMHSRANKAMSRLGSDDWGQSKNLKHDVDFVQTYANLDDITRQAS